MLASLLRYLPSDSVPAGLAILSLAVTIGLAIGAIRIRGVLLGATAAGFYAAPFTPTPGLAAAKEAPRRAAGPNGPGESLAAQAGLAYSITYPFGVVGPVLVIIALRKVFAIKIEDERKSLAAEEE